MMMLVTDDKYYINSSKHAGGDVVRADDRSLDVVAVTLSLIFRIAMILMIRLAIMVMIQMMMMIQMMSMIQMMVMIQMMTMIQMMVMMRAAIMILMIIKTSEMKIEPEQLTPP